MSYDIGVESGLTNSEITASLEKAHDMPDAAAVKSTVDKSKVLSISKGLSAILQKINNGVDITIACEGDSLTYGQDTSATGENTQINGATQKRSPTPYPETLSIVANELMQNGGSATVENRGYPGDTTELALTRWASSDATDLVIMMYGTNDANGYGSDITPFDVFKAEYRLLIERRLAQACAIVLVEPPRLAGLAVQRVLESYKRAVRELGVEYNLPVIKCDELISVDDSGVWTDNVHLTARAYADIGWNISSILCNNINSVTNNTLITAAERLYVSKNHFSDDAYRYGYITQISGNDQDTAVERYIYVAAYSDSEITIGLDLASTSGSSRDLVARTYYGDTEYEGDGPGGYNPSKLITFGRVHKGFNLIKILTTTTNDAFLNAIEFKNYPTISRYQSYPLDGFSGMGKLSTIPEGSFDIFSTRQFFSHFIFDFRFTGLNDTDWQGVYIATDEYKGGATSPTGILVVRKGADRLLVRKFLNGSNDGDLLDSGGIFPSSGDWSGLITVTRDSTGWKFYVDGNLEYSDSTNIPAVAAFAGVRLNDINAKVDSVIAQDY